MSNKPIVLITGYGVFRGYSRNPSAEAVKLVQSILTQTPDPALAPFDIKFIPEIPVLYAEIDKLDFCRLDDTKKGKAVCNPMPTIIVNVGVSHKNGSKVHLESRASSFGYNSPDVEGQRCANQGQHSCSPNGEEQNQEVLESGLDLKLCCQQLNESVGENTAAVSIDAGRYLCEYLFYKSLKCCGKSVFVHVSQESRVSVSETAKILMQAIRFLCAQI